MNPRRHLALTTFLLALLLWAQASLAAHRVDAAAHVAGEQCEWCVAGNSLAGALPTAAVIAPPIAPVVIAPAAVVAPAPTLFYTRYRTRAPPLYFS